MEKSCPRNRAPLVMKNCPKITISQYEGENSPNLVTLVVALSKIIKLNYYILCPKNYKVNIWVWKFRTGLMFNLNFFPYIQKYMHKYILSPGWEIFNRSGNFLTG
jgi:hypothetical protein